MNALKYDAATIGNHEFDFGYDQLKKNLSSARFKVVCADVLDKKGNTIVDANYVFTTPSGLKIGFFGMCWAKMCRANVTLCYPRASAHGPRVINR